MTPEERALSALLHSSTPEPPMTMTGAEIIERARRSHNGRIRRWAPVAATAAVAAGIIAAVAAVSIVPTDHAQAPATQPTSGIDRPVAPEVTPSRGPSGRAPHRTATAASGLDRRPAATSSEHALVGPSADDRPSTTLTVPRCASADLAADVDAGPTADVLVIVVRNEADGACVISGYPDFPALDKLQSPPLQTHPVEAASTPDTVVTGQEPPQVVLAPNGATSFVVDQSWRRVTFDGATVPAEGANAAGNGTITAEAFTIPGDPKPITLPTAIVLRSPGNGGISVQIGPFGVDQRASATSRTAAP
jgi:hypothetical protein